MRKPSSSFLFVIFFVAILTCPLTGFTQDNEVEFDNQSGQIALVKLIGPTMREVNVPINSKFSVTAMPGSYHILVRYGTSDNYQYTKGEKFEVTETTTKRSRTTITLHKVIVGNYDAKPISENEFAVSPSSISNVNKKGSPKESGAALMKQVKTAANRGVQHYQHWLYATFWQDNPVAEGYLG